jgi:F0F1-type ATP synthase assembly protein I
VKLFPRQAPAIRSDDNLGRGMDFALTMLLFLGIGYALDRWLDTRPVFMIVFVVLALVGNFARMWFDYGQKMDRHEADRASALRRDR